MWYACALLLITTGLLHAQEAADSIRHLAFFTGEWEGTGRAYYPREKDRSPRDETVSAGCRPILRGTYMECRMVWTQRDGRSRELIAYWNYNRDRQAYEILFLYDDWGGKVNYPLDFDPIRREFTGSDTFRVKGIAAKEKVKWRISPDGNEIQGVEYNHLETDPEGYWPLTFEFVWRRKRR